MTQREPFDVEVFFDGDCPLCVREINMLRRLDRRSHRIVFTDIASASFDPTSTGRTFRELMDRIHARLPDGTMVEGVEVFRRLYAAVGFGPIVAVTRWWGVSTLLEWGYHAFAKNRLRFTGRCVREVDGVCVVERRTTA
jgi:predicted DCC family thiol-disulfide oxidoreductase YuxK